MDELVFFIDSVQNGDTTVLAYVQSDRNFVSMKTRYDEYVADEMLIVEKWENYTFDSIIINNIDTTIIEHSRLFYEYPEVIKVITHSDGSSHAETNCFSEIVGGFVKRYGFAIIGDELFQVTWDKIKHTPYTGTNSVELLMRSNAMDTTNGVWVYQLKSQSSTWQTMWGRNTVCDGNRNDGGKLRHRLIVYLDFIQWPQGVYKSNQMHTKLRSLQRRLWGSWYNNWKTSMDFTSSGSSNQFYDYYTGSFNMELDLGESPWTIPLGMNVTSDFLHKYKSKASNINNRSFKTQFPHVIINSILVRANSKRYTPIIEIGDVQLGGGLYSIIKDCTCSYP